MEALDKLSQGDFTVQLKAGDDELGQVNAKFNSMVGQIQQLVTTIKSVSEQSAEQSKFLFSTVEMNTANSSAITKNIEEMSHRVGLQAHPLRKASLLWRIFHLASQRLRTAHRNCPRLPC